MNPIFGAILGATGFGTANVVIKKALADVTIPQTLMMSTVSGLLILLVLCIAQGLLFGFSSQTVMVGAGLALLEVILYLVLYKTFEVSNVTVATAVSGTYPIISTLFTVLVLSQAITLEKFGFIVLMVIGGILTSVDWYGVFKNGLDKKDVVKGFNWILLTTLLHAVYFPLLGAFTSEGVWQTKLLLIKAFSTVFLFAFFFLYKKQSVIPPKNRIAFTSLLGLLEVVGWLGYSWASSSSAGQTAVLIAALNSSALVTAILAYFFLNEKLSNIQYVGIVTIIISLTGLSLG